MDSPAPLARAHDALERVLARNRLEDERARFLARSASAATARTYAADLRHFFRWLGVQDERAIPSLDDVRRVSWREVVRYRDRFYQPLESGRAELASATGARRLSVIASFFETLVRAGVVSENPARAVARPRAPEDGTTAGLTPDEVNRVLASAPRGTFRADRDRLFLALLFFQWLRIAEAVRVRADDISEEQGVGVLAIRQKGGRERRIALRGEVFELARIYARNHQISGFLFPTLAAGLGARAISPDGARRLIWRPAVIRAGLDPDRVTPHSARVSGITAALLLGAPLEDVQDFAGHARSETTLRYHRARRRLDRAPVGILPFKL